MYMFQWVGVRKAGGTAGVQKKYLGKQVRNILNFDSCGVGKLWLPTPREGWREALCQWEQQEPELARSVGQWENQCMTATAPPLLSRDFSPSLDGIKLIHVCETIFFQVSRKLENLPGIHQDLQVSRNLPSSGWTKWGSTPEICCAVICPWTKWSLKKV